MIWVIVTVVILLLAREIYIATHIQRSPYIKALCNTSDGSVLLTFDDGPHPTNTPKVLDVLKRHNVKAMFFCIGKEAEKYPEIVQRIVAEGHTIGQHSYSHNPMHYFCGAKHYRSELLKAHKVFEAIGVEILCFRPPLGITNYMVRKAVKAMNYKVVGWSVRSFDTRGKRVDKVMARIRDQITQGSVILLHDRMDDADVLTEKIIETFVSDINRKANIETILR